MRPDRFLARPRTGARGLWARGDHWIAHAGVLRALRVEDEGDGRFRRIREAASKVVCEGGADDDGGREDRLRFYGGFSFRSASEAAGTWEGFPSALFHLPRLELEGHGEGGTVLRIRAFTAPGDEGALERLERRAGELVEELEAPDPMSPPATAAEWTDGEIGGPGSMDGGIPEGIQVDDSGRASWGEAVASILAEVGEGRLAKVVLSRTLDLELHRALDPALVALALWRQSRGAHVFFFEPVPGRAIVGAAPETVATLRAGVFQATAVAGSIRRGESSEEQERLARRLLSSAKDREEQRSVVEDMVRCLRAFTDDIRVQSEPHVLTLPRIQHLETVIRARLGEDRHVLGLLEALHPTPAVCGVPRDRAFEAIRTEEPFERGWYAGPVGWFDGSGDGVFAPALRSAVVRGTRWRLFAGAGIVAGSEADSEWEESGMKFEPVLRALEASGVEVGGGWTATR